MPDPRKLIGVGIVGLSAAGGWAAGAHLPALRAVDGIELRALAASSEASLVLPVLKAGVPVLSEWPLAVDLREAEEMERAAGTTRTFVGLQGAGRGTATHHPSPATTGVVVSCRTRPTPGCTRRVRREGRPALRRPPPAAAASRGARRR